MIKQAAFLMRSVNLCACVIFTLAQFQKVCPAQSVVSQGEYKSTDLSGTTIDMSMLTAQSSLSIKVGSVLTLASRTKVTKIYIADPNVVEAYVANPKQIILNAKIAGETSVVMWDENGKQRTIAISADLLTTQLNEALRAVYPTNVIHAESVGDRITLTGTVGTRAIADEAVKLASQFSKVVVDSLGVNSARVPQVELKVRFIEIDRSRLSQFGINIFGPGGGSAIGGTTTGQFPSSVSVSSGAGGSGGSATSLSNGSSISISNPLELLFYSSKLGAAVSVEDLESKQLAQVLAEPTITTMSGQSASLLAGGEFPFPVVQAAAGGTASVSLQFRPYGVKLEVTPRVNWDNTVELKVKPEVSSLDYTNSVTISGFTIPAISTKTVDTILVLHSGQSFAISGLLDKQTMDSLSRIPGLSQIPFLGSLFRSKATTLSTSELMIIVTPRIIDPLASDRVASDPVLVRPMLDSTNFDSEIRQRTQHR